MLGACKHAFTAALDGDGVFSLDASSLVFGRGALHEVGAHGAALGMRRVALFTDRRVGALEVFERARRSLLERGLDVVVYDEVHTEPTDASFQAAAAFARGGRFDGFVSVGGGSVIDTCKAAALYATYPAELLTYVNAPVGLGVPIPGPLPPHIACPTTCGTGAECTGIAVFDLLSQQVKTGIASRRLRPTLAVIDADATRTLPSAVVAASGFDVLCHALESYTARPHGSRPRPADPTLRPMSQGRNPWSDLGSLEALRIGGRMLVRAVNDATDDEAREQLTWAATLAGIAFGNAGVHLPHAMSYAVAGLVRDFRLDGYPPGEPLIPHGLSVVLGAPSVFRSIAAACPTRCLESAAALGADLRGAGEDDAGEVIAARLLGLLRATGLPGGLAEVGYGPGDVGALAQRAIAQQRLVLNAPCPVDLPAMEALFHGALEPLMPHEETLPPARIDFPYSSVLPTRWMDNDVYGHVNNVVYYSFFDTVINRYLIERGGLDIHGGSVIGLAVETGCRFFRPVAYPEILDAGLRVAHLGRTSVRYEVGIFAQGSEACAALGTFVHVFVDRGSRRPTPPPAALRDALALLTR